MSGCRCECAYLSVLIGIIAGVALGVLFSLGFVATGIIFWLLLIVGFAGVFLAPIYAANEGRRANEGCFCNIRRPFIIAAVGAIITAVLGLILSSFAPVIAIAIVLGFAVFFAVMLVVLVICNLNCICRGNN